MPSLCAQLATVWSLIEGAPLSANRGDEPPEIPDAAIAGIRATMDSMVGPYLERRGKRRYCDKSLGTARYAELLLRVYPQARFICLYRHPMDMIASGIEASPWGMSGYGFDHYIAMTPGNAVLALARYWADNTAATMAAEERFPGQCLRLRYEDLVTDPEGEAARIFAFLDVAPAPGISTSCFSGDRERFGPADHKIWYTSRISPDSIGRGWSVPTGMIAPPILASLNQMTSGLGYLPVDDTWGTSAPPKDLRTPVVTTQEEPLDTVPPETTAPPAKLVAAGDSGGYAKPGKGAQPAHGASSADMGLLPDDSGPIYSGLLADQLRSGLALLGPSATTRWEPHDKENFVAVWVPDRPGQRAEHWLVDLQARTVTYATSAAQDDSAWDIIGTGRAWEQVIGGQLNLSVALRACQLRYCDGDESRPTASGIRVALLAALLRLATW